MTLNAYLADAARLLGETVEADLEVPVEAAITVITAALGHDKPLLICGNGGSAADASHIAGELVGCYSIERRALKALALGTDPAVLTAVSNDIAFAAAFAREVAALGDAGGVVLGISTSGESENVFQALKQARLMAMTSIALTGAGGGRLAAASDILIAVPSRATPRIQEIHTCLYHYICEQVEARIAG
jgi:D-sedoheptulose 7-phosphate isomerase